MQGLRVYLWRAADVKNNYTFIQQVKPISKRLPFLKIAQSKLGILVYPDFLPAKELVLLNQLNFGLEFNFVAYYHAASFGYGIPG